MTYPQIAPANGSVDGESDSGLPDGAGYSSGRHLDPFAYWPHYASALLGFGGTEKPHEPRYCFCTEYVVPTPGRTRYHISISGASATQGEIALRIHALRLSEPPEIGLAASSYIRLDEAIVDGTISYHMEFTALEGLHYALFAYFNAPSNLSAEAVSVVIEESAAPIPVRANLGAEDVSRFAKAEYATSHRLVAPIVPSLRLPLSQACMSEQLQAAAWQSDWPDVVANEPDPLRQWETVAAVRALDLASVDTIGACGLLVDSWSPALQRELERHDVQLDRLSSSQLSGVWEDDEILLAPRAGAFDFVISHAMRHANPRPDAWLKTVGEALRCLRGRGIAIFLLPFWTGTAHELRPAEAADCLDRNAVQQIALRLIGQNYSISQLAFAPPSKQGGVITSFILIAHKLA